MMKAKEYVKELNAKDEKALLEELTNAKKELFNLRFQHATGQLANPMQLKQVKRDIARVKTIMTEMEKAK